MHLLAAPQNAVPQISAKSLLSPSSTVAPSPVRPISHKDLLAEERMDKMHAWGKPINKRPPKKNPTGVQGRPYARSAYFLQIFLLDT